MIVKLFRHFQIYFFLLSLIFVFTACTEKETPLPNHPGRKIFHGKFRLDVKCHGCHGWLGQGGSAPTLVQFGRTINHNKFIDRVLHGKGGMPPFDSVLNKKDVHQIIDWLEKIPQ